MPKKAYKIMRVKSKYYEIFRAIASFPSKETTIPK